MGDGIQRGTTRNPLSIDAVCLWAGISILMLDRGILGVVQGLYETIDSAELPSQAPAYVLESMA